MIRIARREMAIKTKKFKEWNNWYDEQCKGEKKREKTALKVRQRETMRRVGANTILVRRNT
jgi:hypothetical protein